jgi:hypothetical protein
MNVYRIAMPVCLAAAAGLSACSQVADTILTVRETAAEYSETAVRRSVEGARAYRALTDIAGKGPVLEIHCDRL